MISASGQATPHSCGHSLLQVAGLVGFCENCSTLVLDDERSLDLRSLPTPLASSLDACARSNAPVLAFFRLFDCAEQVMRLVVAITLGSDYQHDPKGYPAGDFYGDLHRLSEGASLGAWTHLLYARRSKKCYFRPLHEAVFDTGVLVAKWLAPSGDDKKVINLIKLRNDLAHDSNRWDSAGKFFGAALSEFVRILSETCWLRESYLAARQGSHAFALQGLQPTPLLPEVAAKLKEHNVVYWTKRLAGDGDLVDTSPFFGIEVSEESAGVTARALVYRARRGNPVEFSVVGRGGATVLSRAREHVDKTDRLLLSARDPRVIADRGGTNFLPVYAEEEAKFVGRTAELNEIDSAVLQFAGSGEAQFLWVHGQAGIGKSALAAAFSVRLHARWTQVNEKEQAQGNAAERVAILWRFRRGDSRCVMDQMLEHGIQRLQGKDRFPKSKKTRGEFLRTFLIAVRKRAAQRNPVVLVVDGIDEIFEIDRHVLDDLLEIRDAGAMVVAFGRNTRDIVERRSEPGAATSLPDLEVSKLGRQSLQEWLIKKLEGEQQTLLLQASEPDRTRWLDYLLARTDGLPLHIDALIPQFGNGFEVLREDLPRAANILDLMLGRISLGDVDHLRSQTVALVALAQQATPEPVIVELLMRLHPASIAKDVQLAVPRVLDSLFPILDRPTVEGATAFLPHHAEIRELFTEPNRGDVAIPREAAARAWGELARDPLSCSEGVRDFALRVSFQQLWNGGQREDAARLLLDLNLLDQRVHVKADGNGGPQRSSIVFEIGRDLSAAMKCEGLDAEERKRVAELNGLWREVAPHLAQGHLGVWTQRGAAPGRPDWLREQLSIGRAARLESWIAAEHELPKASWTHAVEGEDSPYRNVAISSNGHVVAAVSLDGAVDVWRVGDPATRRLLHPKPSAPRPSRVDLDDRGEWVLVGGSFRGDGAVDREIRLIQVGDESVRVVRAKGESDVVAIAIHPKALSYAFALADGTVWVGRLDQDKTKCIARSMWGCRAIKFISTEGYEAVWAVSSTQVLYYRSTESGNHVDVHPLSPMVNSLAAQQGGAVAAHTGGSFSFLRADGAIEALGKTTEQDPLAAVATPSRSHVVSLSRSDRLVVSCGTAEPSLQIQAKAMAVSRDGAWLVATALDRGVLRAWRLRDLERPSEGDSNLEDPITSLVVDESTARAVAVHARHEARYWDLTGSPRLMAQHSFPERISNAALLLQNQLLAIDQGKSGVAIWNPADGSISQVQAGQRAITGISSGADGALLFARGNSVWLDPLDGQGLAREVATTSSQSRKLVATADGNRVAGMVRGGQLFVAETQSMSRGRPEPGHVVSVDISFAGIDMTLSADGAVLLSVGTAGVLLRAGAKFGDECRVELEGVIGSSFSANGGELLVVCRDRALVYSYSWAERGPAVTLRDTWWADVPLVGGSWVGKERFVLGDSDGRLQVLKLGKARSN